MTNLLKHTLPARAILLAAVIAMAGCREDPAGMTIGFNHILKIDTEPTWSPDGEWIAYIHNPPPIDSADAGQRGIYLIRPDGTDNQLWLAGWGFDAPDWSPNGEWIAYERGGQIYKRSVSGDSLVQLTFEDRNYFPTWSPDGEWIAFDSNRSESSTFYFIWKMDKDGNNKVVIANTPQVGETRMAKWSTDNQIYHVRYLDDNSPDTEIHMMDGQGKNVARLTENNFQDEHPDYSPEAGLITYTSYRIEDGRWVPGIWVMEDDGSNKVNLTGQENFYGDYSRWSPDGSRIVFTNAYFRNGRLWIMDKDGSNKRQLTH